MAMALPGVVAKRAVAEALANAGVRESGKIANWGRWVRIYLASVGILRPAEWCAAFVFFRLRDAALDLHLALPESFPMSGWVPDYVAWARGHGLWISQHTAAAYPDMPKRGDLVVYAKGLRYYHIGFVTAVYSWGVTTVEGNSAGPDGKTNAVWEHHAQWLDVGGFVRIPA